jgi:hypothetical protein
VPITSASHSYVKFASHCSHRDRYDDFISKYVLPVGDNQSQTDFCVPKGGYTLVMLPCT